MLDYIYNLIEAIEDERFLQSSEPWEHEATAYAAFSGSLDAAWRLHDALLPQWQAEVEAGAAAAGVKVWSCTVEHWDTCEEISAHNQPSPPRAWLLATLKAYAEELSA